jgi:hypothetical protein
MIFHEIREIKCEEGKIIKVKVLPFGTTDTVTYSTGLPYPLLSITSYENYEVHGFKYEYELTRTTDAWRLPAYVKYLITNNIARIVPI